MDRPDYAVYCSDWEVGRIYETHRDQAFEWAEMVLL
jgi:hypothetical protein